MHGSTRVNNSTFRTPVQCLPPVTKVRTFALLYYGIDFLVSEVKKKGAAVRNSSSNTIADLGDERPLRQQHGQPHFVLLHPAAFRLLRVGAGIFYRSSGWDDCAEDLVKARRKRQNVNKRQTAESKER